MQNKKMWLIVILAFAFVFPAYGRVRKYRRYKKPVTRGYEKVQNAFQITYGLGPTLLAPAGLDAIDIYPEIYLPVDGLSLGLNLAWIPIAENNVWGLPIVQDNAWGFVINFVNVKYTWVPKKFPRLQPYIRTGWGLLVAGVYGHGSDVTFDWVFGSGATIWLTNNIGLGTDFNTHLTRDGNLFVWLYSFRYKYGW